jgi:DNA-binding beta-propeller fold protein YncE
LSDYDRFEYLELDGATPQQVCTPPPAPRTTTTERVVSEAPSPTHKLVVDQIIGSHGTAIGEFNCPCGLAVDRQGNLYVCDAYNHRIQKITPNGDATAIGGRGAEPGKFLNPQDIFIDDQSTMYILEQGNNRIQKITHDGRLERVIGQHGERDRKSVV